MRLFFYLLFFSGYKLLGQIIDIDGNSYKTVKIGEQVWMAENLRVTRLNNGTEIKQIKDSNDWVNYADPAYCFFNNNISLANGALYNFYSVETDKLCPLGWNVPNNYDWNYLLNEIGGEKNAGEILKATESWDSGQLSCYSMNGKNSVGFNILRSGARGTGGKFIGQGSSFWTKDQSHYYLFCSETMLHSDFINKNAGYSVRCIKDKNVENKKSNLLNGLENWFSLNSGDLFSHLQNEENLKNQTFINQTKVRFYRDNGFTFDFVFFDSSLKRLKDITVISNNSQFYNLIEKELANNVRFKKITSNENLVHYSSDYYQYLLGKEKIEDGWTYVVMIYFID